MTTDRAGQHGEYEHVVGAASKVAPHEHHYDLIGRRAGSSGPDFNRECRRAPHCPGIAYVQIAWAPDTGWHWLRCCCCGDYWNPGVAR